MKQKLAWLDRIMTAVTFAEANEHKTAKKFLACPGLIQEQKLREEKCSTVLALTHGAEAQS